MKVVAEVQEKLKRISVPQGYSVVPILIAVGDVSDGVCECDYFNQIVDMTGLGL